MTNIRYVAEIPKLGQTGSNWVIHWENFSEQVISSRRSGESLGGRSAPRPSKKKLGFIGLIERAMGVYISLLSLLMRDTFECRLYQVKTALSFPAWMFLDFTVYLPQQKYLSTTQSESLVSVASKKSTQPEKNL